METALTIPSLAGLPVKTQNKLIKLYQQQQDKQMFVDGVTKVADSASGLLKELLRVIGNAVSNNELAAGVAMWLVIDLLEKKTDWLTALDASILKTGVVATSAWDIISPF